MSDLSVSAFTIVSERCCHDSGLLLCLARFKVLEAIRANKVDFTGNYPMSFTSVVQI